MDRYLSNDSGRVTVGERAWNDEHSLGSRFADGAGASPEELIAQQIELETQR